ELLLAMRMGALAPSQLIDLKGIPGFAGVRLAEGQQRLMIGAGTTHREVERSALVQRLVPELSIMTKRIGNVRVRAAGTWRGNLAFGEPRSDVAPLAMCLDAVCHVTSPRGTRTVPLADFAHGPYEVDLAPAEI